MNSADPSRLINVLLLEDNKVSGEKRADSIRAIRGHNRSYDVALATCEEDARELVRNRRFDFLLADLLLKRESGRSTRGFITDDDVDDPANGPKVVRRLLEFHRRVHQERPSDTSQLRPIIYSAAQPEPNQEERIRVKILCDGAYDFISREPEPMLEVLKSLGDMCDLQIEMQRIVGGTSWVGRILQNLGCGISVIGQNWKIWYCSKQNAELSGLEPSAFHDQVCWREYHRFDGLYFPCPECPAMIVMRSTLCPKPESRDFRCIVRRYPFEQLDRTCLHPEVVGGNCANKGVVLSSYSNCRLLCLKGYEPRWVYVIATPITSQDGERILGALETVFDLHNIHEGFLDSKQLAGKISACDRILPILNLGQWLSYNRIRIFRTSADGKELVGLTETGNQLTLGEFSGYRFPASESILGQGEGQLCRDERVIEGPGHDAEKFGKTKCRQYMEFILRDPTNNEPLGTMVVDDVKDSRVGSDRVYNEADLKRLRPLASYGAKILSIQRQYEREQTLAGHAEALRGLEKCIDDCMPEIQNRPRTYRLVHLQKLFAEQLRGILKKEPGLWGFHLRFVGDDGLLYLFKGAGAYSEVGKNEPVRVDDENSLSAKCFSTNAIQMSVDADTYGPFQAFVRQIGKKVSDGGTSDALEWTKAVKVLGCFPITWGSMRIGTLAIQSNASDFFSTEAVQFIKDLCNFMARVLGAIREEDEHYAFLENVAYSFRGPASKILDIVENRMLVPGRGVIDAEAEGAFGLAYYLYNKACTFGVEGATGGVKSVRKAELSLGDLVKKWRALFRGLSVYGSKQVEIETCAMDDMGSLTVYSDPELLTEIVYNIVENAISACRGTVRIRGQVMPSALAIVVDDDGRGLSDTARRKMWDGYHEDYEIGASKGFGGLGLKWSKRHAGLLGITLDGRQHGDLGGASFSIIIPTERNH
jgi:PAS domain-containing protein